MGITSTQSSINNLTTPGSYCVTVNDVGSCTFHMCYNIQNNYNLYASISTTDVNCSNNGTATVQVQGVHPPFTYQWSDTLHQTTAQAINLDFGNYLVTVIDSIGCLISGYAQINSQCLNVIKGRVYNDENLNCNQEIGEVGLQGLIISSTPGSYYAYTDSLGDYTIYTPFLNSSVSLSNYYTQFFTPTCPLSGVLSVSFNQIGDTSIGNNFGFHLDSNYYDLSIHPGWSEGNPGFQKHYWIYYYNNNPAPVNAIIRFQYDTVLQFSNCTQNGINIPSQHTIEWAVNNIPQSNIYSWTHVDAFLVVPVSTPLTYLLTSYFEILPIAEDCNPYDNTISVIEPITGSHDPNSKSVIPEGVGTEGYILQSDSVLLYTIHFQNNGNDTAFTVIVIDTLSQYLDPATIVLGAASHPYTFNISGRGIITFRFDHILLPDSFTNEPASNGYLNFTIKQKHDNSLGTVINNYASIYFDFNQPIITNSVINTITDAVTIKGTSKNQLLI